MIEFTTDRRKVTEGDIIEVRWGCPNAEKVTLTLDNGYKASSIELPDNGYKKFRLNRSKGRTCLTLEATIAGHTSKQKLYVRVKPMKAVKADTVNHDGTKYGIKDKWRKFREQLRYNWRALPEKKQFAYKILGILSLGLILSFFSPRLVLVGVYVVIFYLFWVIFKR